MNAILKGDDVMRCTICDSLLTDNELTKINRRTGEFKDLCYKCDGAIYNLLSEFETELPEQNNPIDKPEEM